MSHRVLVSASAMAVQPRILFSPRQNPVDSAMLAGRQYIVVAIRGDWHNGELMAFRLPS